MAFVSLGEILARPAFLTKSCAHRGGRVAAERQAARWDIIGTIPPGLWVRPDSNWPSKNRMLRTTSIDSNRQWTGWGANLCGLADESAFMEET